MKALIVGILAVLTLAGCGVGVDDAEYAALQAQSLEGTVQQGASVANQAIAGPVAPIYTETSTSMGEPDGTVALPQDPVPIHPSHKPVDNNGGASPPTLVVVIPGFGAVPFVIQPGPPPMPTR